MHHFARIYCSAYFFLLPFLSLLLPLEGNAQLQWAHQIGNVGRDGAESHVVDRDGNIIVTGYFENSVSIGGFTLTSMDESDIFVYKTKPDGNVLWAKTFGGPVYGGDVGVDTDANGNIYLAGGFIEELYVDGVLTLSAVPDNDHWNSFLAKLDSDGNLMWTKGLLGTNELSELRVWGLISVNESSIAIAGNYGGSISIDGQVLSQFNGSGDNLFIAKFDLNGNLNWLKNPPSDTNVECRKIQLDNSGNVYLTGLFTTTAHFDSFTITATNNTHSDIYLAKLNSAGFTQWVKTGLKTANRTDNNTGWSFTIDPAGNVYLVGRLKGDVKFDHILLHGNTTPETFITDAFIAKYSANGVLLRATLYGESFKANVTDIEYSSNRIFILGMSNTSLQFFHSILNADQLTGEPVLLDGHGFPSNITISPQDAAVFISGEMSFLTTTQNEFVTKGNSDGFLARVGTCKSQGASVLAIIGPRELCRESKVTYTVAPAEDVTHYVWDLPDFLQPGGNTNSVTSTIDATPRRLGSGLITVYGVDKCGVKGSTVALPVQVLAVPDKPILEKKDCSNEMRVLNGQNVEWYKDNELIPDENDNLLIASDSGSYYAISRNYCGASQSETVSVDPISKIEIFFENVITPNGDGKNDFFQVEDVVLNSELRIYDRWGVQVFRKQPYDNSWNATNLPGGVYYYTVRGHCTSVKGWVQVIKDND